MKCGYCNTEIIRPLELYDGRWCCPNCKKDVFPGVDSEFVIDALNKELYVRSEEYFYKWLTRRDDDKQTRFKYLDRAVNLCSEAAFRSHPAALMRMGYYYDNGYIDFTKSEEERWTVAYFYYKAVCFNVHKSVETADGEAYADEIREIKVECARRLANMLKKPPRAVGKKGSFDGYVDLDALRKSVLDKIKQLGGEYDEGEYVLTGKHDYDNADVAYVAWRSCFDEERAPLLGIFRLTKQEAQKFFRPLGNGYSVPEKISRDTRLKIAETFDEKEVEGRFYEFRNSDALIKYAEGCPDNGIYVCFINGAGGHKYLKKRQINAFAKCMSAQNNAHIKRLISAKKYNASVFYDDDVFRYMEKRTSMEKAVEKFISDICEEDKNN